MSLTQHEIAEFVSEFFTTKQNTYQKYFSPENLNEIVSRVVSFGIHPSATAVKRAILELVEEGQIERTDGKDEADDEREAEQAAEDQDRRSALAAPLTQADAAVYASLSPVEIAYKFNHDRVWRFRYEAASRLWGFRLPIAVSYDDIPASAQADDGPPVPQTAEEYHRLPTHVTVRRYRNEPRFRSAVQKLINEGKI
jgi:hypothetical protein